MAIEVQHAGDIREENQPVGADFTKGRRQGSNVLQFWHKERRPFETRIQTSPLA
jgi:hypothetical protein